MPDANTLASYTSIANARKCYETCLTMQVHRLHVVALPSLCTFPESNVCAVSLPEHTEFSVAELWE